MEEQEKRDHTSKSTSGRLTTRLLIDERESELISMIDSDEELGTVNEVVQPITKVTYKHPSLDDKMGMKRSADSDSRDSVSSSRGRVYPPNDSTSPILSDRRGKSKKSQEQDGSQSITSNQSQNSGSTITAYSLPTPDSDAWGKIKTEGKELKVRFVTIGESSSRTKIEGWYHLEPIENNGTESDEFGVDFSELSYAMKLRPVGGENQDIEMVMTRRVKRPTNDLPRSGVVHITYPFTGTAGDAAQEPTLHEMRRRTLSSKSLQKRPVRKSLVGRDAASNLGRVQSITEDSLEYDYDPDKLDQQLTDSPDMKTKLPSEKEIEEKIVRTLRKEFSDSVEQCTDKRKSRKRFTKYSIVNQQQPPKITPAEMRGKFEHFEGEGNLINSNSKNCYKFCIVRENAENSSHDALVTNQIKTHNYSKAQFNILRSLYMTLINENSSLNNWSLSLQYLKYFLRIFKFAFSDTNKFFKQIPKETLQKTAVNFKKSKIKSSHSILDSRAKEKALLSCIIACKKMLSLNTKSIVHYLKYNTSEIIGKKYLKNEKVNDSLSNSSHSKINCDIYIKSGDLINTERSSQMSYKVIKANKACQKSYSSVSYGKKQNQKKCKSTSLTYKRIASFKQKRFFFYKTLCTRSVRKVKLVMKNQTILFYSLYLLKSFQSSINCHLKLLSKIKDRDILKDYTEEKYNGIHRKWRKYKALKKNRAFQRTRFNFIDLETRKSLNKLKENDKKLDKGIKNGRENEPEDERNEQSTGGGGERLITPRNDSPHNHIDTNESNKRRNSLKKLDVQSFSNPKMISTSHSKGAGRKLPSDNNERSDNTNKQQERNEQRRHSSDRPPPDEGTGWKNTGETRDSLKPHHQKESHKSAKSKDKNKGGCFGGSKKKPKETPKRSNTKPDKRKPISKPFDATSANLSPTPSTLSGVNLSPTPSEKIEIAGSPASRNSPQASRTSRTPASTRSPPAGTSSTSPTSTSSPQEILIYESKPGDKGGDVYAKITGDRVILPIYPEPITNPGFRPCECDRGKKPKSSRFDDATEDGTQPGTTGGSNGNNKGGDGRPGERGSSNDKGGGGKPGSSNDNGGGGKPGSSNGKGAPHGHSSKKPGKESSHKCSLPCCDKIIFPFRKILGRNKSSPQHDESRVFGKYRAEANYETGEFNIAVDRDSKKKLLVMLDKFSKEYDRRVKGNDRQN